MTLTKSNIADQIQNDTDLSKPKSIKALETTLEIMKRTLESGEDVMITGFGKFEVKDKNPRKGRNPQTGNDLTLNARRVITFRFSGG